MGYHEQLSQDSSLYSALEKKDETELLPLDDPHIQKALIEIWGQARSRESHEEELTHNDLGFAWVNSGMAAKYRTYAEMNTGQEVDVRDAHALAQLLSELGTETIH